MKFQFKWEEAFEKAFSGQTTSFEKHLLMAKREILLPLLEKKTRSPNEAEEIAALVMTKFWERFYMKQEPLPSNVNGYLYTMASNAHFHHAKAKDKKIKLYINKDVGDMYDLLDTESVLAGPGELTPDQEKERLFQIMDQTVDMLEDKCRKLIRMFVYERKKMKDIHKILGIPTSNAATKKKEACINKLKKLLFREIQAYNSI